MRCHSQQISDVLDEETISKLCDCGRHKKKAQTIPERRKPQSFETAYGSTFRQYAEVRPRSSKRPPPSPRDPNPPPMSFITNQRAQFRPIRNAERAPLLKQEETYQPPSGNMRFDTNYNREFIFKESEPSTRRVAGPSDARRQASGRMDSTTTSKEHFKHWVAQPQMTFQELPSFAGSILYPEKAPLPESTSKNSYRGEYVPPADYTKSSALTANILIEGDMDLGTTAREAFKGFYDYERAAPANPKSRIKNFNKVTFQGVTQTKHDFAGFKNGVQPLPPKPVTPPLPTIDLKYDNRRNFDTEQRATFQGHDIRKHPVSQSCKKDNEVYKPPNVKFETQTSQKRDYLPIDLNSAYTARASQPASKYQPPRDDKFEDTTMNKVFFKNWGPQVSRRRRYGDFHESHKYVPTMEPFSGESTSQRTFTPKQAQTTKNYKPNPKPAEVTGNMNFDTEYRLSYITKKAPICRAQAYIMQKELERRQAVQNPVVSTRQAVSVKQ